MLNKVTLAVSIFSVFLFSELSAQNVYFTGVGRALVTNDHLSDNTTPASKLKASGGYTLFDLGINAKAGDILRGSVIFRVRNEFGGFFSDGASLEFRQMQMEGLIAKKVKYEIGDIYLKNTRYTLWNEETLANKYEANVFSLRRDIVNYENFFIGNAWRMQGVNLKTQLNFDKGIESLGIKAFGGHTRQNNIQSNLNSIPDRYFYGGRLDLKQSGFFRIAGNVSGISDIPGTVKNAQVNYNNMVYTTDFDFTLDQSEKFKFVLEGEVGASHFDLTRASDNTSNKYDDFFYDLGLKGTFKPLGLTLGGSYRDVGYNFNSPMAQTRRMSGPGAVLTNFPILNDSTTGRQISLLDTYSQERNLYNQAISTTLMSYYMQYDIVEPYGRATPNRRGVTIFADIETPNKLLNATFEANLLSEGVAEGDSVTGQKRKFTLLRGGLVFNVNKLFNFEKLIAINAGIRTENSTRGGSNPVNLSNSLIDLGLDVEVIKDLHLVGGVKLFTANGTEYQSVRNDFNQISAFTNQSFNQKQNILAAGLRYDFGAGCYFSGHYHMLNFIDNNATRNNYKLNQVFLVFGMKF